MIDNLDNLAPNNGMFILAGDSAGGNIAIASTLALQHQYGMAGCLAIYPATQHYISDLPSYTEHAKSGLVPARNMRWCCDAYLGDLAPADPVLERVFPGRRTSLNDFPRTLIITAERDPIRDDGARFAVKLHRAGCKVMYKHLETASHGFVCSEETRVTSNGGESCQPMAGNTAYSEIASRRLRISDFSSCLGQK